MSARYTLIIVMATQHVSIQRAHLLAHVTLVIPEAERRVKVNSLRGDFALNRDGEQTKNM